METVMTSAQVCVHPSALTEAGARRLAKRISHQHLLDERSTLTALTQVKFDTLRQECLHLGRLMEAEQPETVGLMLKGLDIFVESFLKLAVSVDAAGGRSGEADGLGTPS
ncbi:hypothetical protein MMA231_04248 (plasmid) [Asticcacaulis sp. MM231]|uniref:hypothetical protein n=1 Tax=Asticcacaulis sp. MM231 TaxID=3157666 RepID=UPI0032D5A625